MYTEDQVKSVLFTPCPYLWDTEWRHQITGETGREIIERLRSYEDLVVPMSRACDDCGCSPCYCATPREKRNVLAARFNEIGWTW